MHHPIDEPTREQKLARAAELLRAAERVVVLTGAGVSAESGIATFRGAGGMWEDRRVEDVATPSAFARDPALVWRFYNERRAGVRDVKPNAGHLTLARLEERWSSARFTLATQNIDGLHRVAGSRHVLELHGLLSRVRCTKCDYLADRPGETLPDLPKCPNCEALLRPDIVWFEEMLPQDAWGEAFRETQRCQCFLIVGTSAIVYPAAGLVQLAKSAGASVLEFNIEQTHASHAADVSLFGPAGEMLPEVERLL